MRKIILVWLVFIACIIACNNKEKDPADEGRIQKPVPNDTFNVVSIETDPRLQKDILLDTIKDGDEKDKRTIIVPRSLSQELPKEYERLDHLIQKGWSDEAPGGADSLVESKEFFEQLITPLSLYKDSNVFSYSFESALSSSGATRHFFKYHTINHDLKLKRKISFDDFFITDKLSDRKFLQYAIIEKCLDLDAYYTSDTAGFTIMRDINFSFDKDYVYFYVDMFEFGNATGIVGSIRKKYILDYIKPAYK